MVTLEQVPATQRRELVSKADVPGTWKVHKNGMIAFESYINETRAKALWDNNVKKFLFDILKKNTDASKAVILGDVLDLRADRMSVKLTDVLVRTLTRQCVPPDQIARCLCQNTNQV